MMTKQSLEDEKNFSDLPNRIEEYQKNHTQRFNMSGYAAPKISTVRIGIIGTGNRGSHHAGTISRVSDVEIKAAADVLPERFGRIKKNTTLMIPKSSIYIMNSAIYCRLKESAQ